MKIAAATLFAALAPALCAADGTKRIITSLEEVAEVCRTSIGTDATFDAKGKVWSYYRGVLHGAYVFFVPLSDGSNTVTICEMPSSTDSASRASRPTS